MVVFVVTEPVSQQEAVPAFDVPSSILSRLRLETRGEHEAVEQVLDLMSDSLTPEVYCHRLEQFYGFYAPMEKALQARELTLLPATRAALAGRLNKTALLRQDLQHLGARVENVPLCRNLPPLSTQAEVLGCVYVMEGATLGGRVITKQIRAALGITPVTGGSFFEGYGDDTGMMWQGMRHLLASGAQDTETENTIVANAVATFSSLRDWCESFYKQFASGATLDV